MIEHRPRSCTWKALEEALVGPGSLLDSELKEQVRRTLAQRTGCAYCASLGGPADQRPDPTEALCVAFAEEVAEDHRAITDGQVAMLVEELGTAQTVELLTFICFEYAGQMLGALMGDEPASEDEKQAFHAWVASRGRSA